jgi:hypothetical protein
MSSSHLRSGDGRCMPAEDVVEKGESIQTRLGEIGDGNIRTLDRVCGRLMLLFLRGIAEFVKICFAM